MTVEVSGPSGASVAVQGGLVNLTSVRYSPMPDFVPSAVRANSALSAAVQIYYEPFIVKKQITLTDLAVQPAAGAAGKKIRVAMYRADTNWQPLALVADAGECDQTALDANVLAKAPTVSAVLAPGLYVKALMSDSNPNLFYLRGGPVVGIGTANNDLSYVYQLRKSSAAAYGSPFVDPGTAFTAADEGVSDGFRHMVLARWT